MVDPGHENPPWQDVLVWIGSRQRYGRVTVEGQRIFCRNFVPAECPCRYPMTALNRISLAQCVAMARRAGTRACCRADAEQLAEGPPFIQRWSDPAKIGHRHLRPVFVVASLP